MKIMAILAFITLPVGMSLAYSLTINNETGHPIQIQASDRFNSLVQPKTTEPYVYENVNQIQKLDIQGVPLPPSGGMIMSEPQSYLIAAKEVANEMERDMIMTIYFRRQGDRFASIRVAPAAEQE